MPTPLFIITICLLCFGVYPANSHAEEILTWNDCILEAAKNHPDLIAAQEEIKQSEAEKTITASILYPQVDSDLTASTQRNATDKQPATTQDSYNYGLNASQLIFDGNKTINNVRAATENVNASEQNFKFVSATVRYRLRAAFIDLLASQEMLRIAQEIYNIRRGNLELITLRYQSGLEHRGALLTAEADLAEANYGIEQALRNIEVAQGKMVKEMGRKQLTPIRVNGDFLVRDTAQPKPDFYFLSKNNPALQQITAQKNAAEFNLRSTYGNFFPQLSADADANKNGAHWGPKGDQWGMGLVLSMPIFEGGLRIAQVQQARGLLNQLRENERSTKDSVVMTLEDTWATLQDALDFVGVQHKRLIATEERSKIAQAQYSIGSITFDNWTIIEDNLVKAKRVYLDAQAAVLLAEANWIQAKGETLEYAKKN